VNRRAATVERAAPAATVAPRSGFLSVMPSTAIRAISYDEVTSTLFVTFVDGDTYAYFDVPPAVFQAFGRARSKGGFFAARIRPNYRYQKVEGAYA
jgi:hypothetical protein